MKSRNRTNGLLSRLRLLGVSLIGVLPGYDVAVAGPAATVDRINALLRQRPASEDFCGEMRSRVSLEGGWIVLETSWSRCPGKDRRTVPARELVTESIETEITPEYGLARVHVPCRNGKPCSPRFTLGENETAWRHLRDESLFTIDCAPGAHVAQQIEEAVRQLVHEMQAG